MNEDGWTSPSMMSIFHFFEFAEKQMFYMQPHYHEHVIQSAISCKAPTVYMALICNAMNSSQMP